VAETLAGHGMKVALVGRNRARLLAVARVVTAHGGEPLAIVCDQRSIAANERMLRRVRQSWGRVDVLVNCSACRGGRTLLKTDWREIQDALDLNLGATLWCARAVAAQMSRSTGGAIITISSLTGHRVLAGTPAVYAATKQALRILTDGLRAEIVERRLPIKVALVSPGLVDTPWHRGPGGLLRAPRRGYPHAPLQAADVAEAVRYILTAPSHVQVSDVLLRSSEQPD
jgi:NADP-dependent 3-hydroxy acid dehydrogenase YdfG